MKIVSMPMGMLSNLLKDEVVIKKTWKSKKNSEKTIINALKDLFLMLYQKIKAKKKYSKKVKPTWKYFLKLSGISPKKNRKLKQKRPYIAMVVGTTSFGLFFRKK